MKPVFLIGLALLLAACGSGHDPQDHGGRGGRGARGGTPTVGYVVIQQGSAPIRSRRSGRR